MVVARTVMSGKPNCLVIEIVRSSKMSGSEIRGVFSIIFSNIFEIIIFFANIWAHFQVNFNIC